MVQKLLLMSSRSKTIDVAVGVLINKDNQVLIAKRAKYRHQGDLWEFPGGKVEQGEEVLSALQREFKEEVAVDVHSAEPFLTMSHDYGDKCVCLHVLLSNDFSGQARGLESQPVKWIAVDQLSDYPFPEANNAIISEIKKRFN